MGIQKMTPQVKKENGPAFQIIIVSNKNCFSESCMLFIIIITEVHASYRIYVLIQLEDSMPLFHFRDMPIANVNKNKLNSFHQS